MFKPTLSKIGPVLVLISGLVSCAPDKHKADVYVAPTPKIIKGSETISLRDWDRATKKELDLHDTIDVQGSGAESVEVVSRCRRGINDVYGSQRLPNPRLISLFQVLPLEIVAADLKASPAACGLEVTLRNSNGSKHVFTLPLATITDQQRPRAILLRHGEPIVTPRDRLMVQHLGGIKLRDSGSATGLATVFCEDGKSRDLPYSGVVDLSDFDFDRMEVYPGKSPRALEFRPLQSCRLMILKEQIPQAISLLFELHLRRAPLKVRATALLQRTPSFTPAALSTLMTGRPTLTGTYRVENPSAGTRWLKIPKATRLVQLTAIDSSGYSGSVIRPYLRLIPLRNLKTTIAEEPGHWLVQIPESGFVDIISEVKAPAPINCVSGIRSTFIVDFHQLAELEEVSETGATLTPYTFELGPRMYFTTMQDPVPKPSSEAFSARHLCNW